MASSSSITGPSKRPRQAPNGSQPLSCLVDGCNSDLSSCRDYHRRHKVCELHAKTPLVMIRGLNQRFCQQCSRFHSLEEFDEGKRSCRKRLDGHNRRRRKPQPESFSQPNPSILYSYQGSGLGELTRPYAWRGAINSEADSGFFDPYQVNFLHKQSNFHESSTSTRRACERGESVNPCPLLPPMAFPVNGDCALSLLSSPTTLPSLINSSHIDQPMPMDSDKAPIFKNDEFNSSLPSLWDQ